MMADKQPATGPYKRRMAHEKAERDAAVRDAEEAAEKRSADHQGRISDLERQVAALTRASRAADRDEEDREDRIAKLERLVHLLAKANSQKRATIDSLKNQVKALTITVQRLQASQAIPAGRKRRRDDLDATLERELYEG